MTGSPSGLPFSDDFWTSIDRVSILACGTSWHAALVGKFLIEQMARIPVDVDYASEYRYRDPIVTGRTLAIAITQSGETADTVAALEEAALRGARTLSVCNSVGSQVTRLAEGSLFTRAGLEMGVASTKAFTTQLAVLTLLALHLGQASQCRCRKRITRSSSEACAPCRHGSTACSPPLERNMEELARQWFTEHGSALSWREVRSIRWPSKALSS